LLDIWLVVAVLLVTAVEIAGPPLVAAVLLLSSSGFFDLLLTGVEFFSFDVGVLHKDVLWFEVKDMCLFVFKHSRIFRDFFETADGLLSLINIKQESNLSSAVILHVLRLDIVATIFPQLFVNWQFVLIAVGLSWLLLHALTLWSEKVDFKLKGAFLLLEDCQKELRVIAVKLAVV